MISLFAMNVITCGALCAVAQLLAIFRGEIPAFSAARYAVNFCVAYPVACIAGWFIPSERFGLWLGRTLRVKPGFLFGVVMTCGINLIFTLIFSTIMTWFNAVLMGGQSMAVLIPGVLGNENSALDESIYSGLLEHPQYTQPREYRGMKVPEVLTGGNHKLIHLWKLRESLVLTKERRPDLFRKYIARRNDRDSEGNRIFDKKERAVIDEVAGSENKSSSRGK